MPNHSLNVAVQLPADHPVVRASGGTAGTFLTCSYLCQNFMAPLTATVYHADGTPGDLDCPRAQAATADPSRTPGAITPDILPTLMRSSRVPTDAEAELERDDPALRLGDPGLPPHRKGRGDREGAVTSIEAMSQQMALLSQVILTSALDAIMALPPAARAALPAVRIDRATGQQATYAAAGAPSPAATTLPLPVALAWALTNACTANGLNAIAAHVNLSSSAWKSASVSAYATAPDGSLTPVNYFWDAIRKAVGNDLSVRLPSLLRAPPTSIDSALAPITSSTPIAAHGAAASLVTWAPRVGTLLPNRRDPLGRPLMASTWREWYDALVAGASATRKEVKAIGAVPGQTPRPAPCFTCGRLHGGVCRFAPGPRTSDGGRAAGSSSTPNQRAAGSSSTSNQRSQRSSSSPPYKRRRRDDDSRPQTTDTGSSSTGTRSGGGSKGKGGTDTPRGSGPRRTDGQ